MRQPTNDLRYLTDHVFVSNKLYAFLIAALNLLFLISFLRFIY